MEFESSVKTPFLVTIWVYNQSTRIRGSPTPSLVWAVWPPACRTEHRLRLICPSYRATPAPPQLNSIKQKRKKIALKTNLGHSDKRLKAPTPTTKNWERRQKTDKEEESLGLEALRDQCLLSHSCGIVTGASHTVLHGLRHLWGGIILLWREYRGCKPRWLLKKEF